MPYNTDRLSRGRQASGTSHLLQEGSLQAAASHSAGAAPALMAAPKTPCSDMFLPPQVLQVIIFHILFHLFSHGLGWAPHTCLRPMDLPLTTPPCSPKVTSKPDSSSLSPNFLPCHFRIQPQQHYSRLPKLRGEPAPSLSPALTET